LFALSNKPLFVQIGVDDFFFHTTLALRKLILHQKKVFEFLFHHAKIQLFSSKMQTKISKKPLKMSSQS
jgi:hypothetical protein